LHGIPCKRDSVFQKTLKIFYGNVPARNVPFQHGDVPFCRVDVQSPLQNQMKDCFLDPRNGKGDKAQFQRVQSFFLGIQRGFKILLQQGEQLFLFEPSEHIELVLHIVPFRRFYADGLAPSGFFGCGIPVLVDDFLVALFVLASVYFNDQSSPAVHVVWKFQRKIDLLLVEDPDAAVKVSFSKKIILCFLLR